MGPWTVPLSARVLPRTLSLAAGGSRDKLADATTNRSKSSDSRRPRPAGLPCRQAHEHDQIQQSLPPPHHAKSAKKPGSACYQSTSGQFATANTPQRARTSNLRFRRPMLYPIELGVRGQADSIAGIRSLFKSYRGGVKFDGLGADSRPDCISVVTSRWPRLFRRGVGHFFQHVAGCGIDLEIQLVFVVNVKDEAVEHLVE